MALLGSGEGDHDVCLIQKLVMNIHEWDMEKHLGSVQKHYHCGTWCLNQFSGPE